MIAETGHYALILALGVAIVQTLLPLLGARFRDPQLAAVAAPAAQMQFVLVAIAFVALMTAYVTSDFSVENVWRNSHSAKPLLYKISGVWGNHEGSMVLWVLILALFGAAVATFGTNLPRQLKANVLAVQGSIGAAFLLFIVTTSNPFTRLDPAPFDGQGLNPVLQDPALAFHPPFLYAGYVGFSMAFSFAVAALDRRPHRRRLGALGAGHGRSPPGCASRSASPWARGGPITSSAGAGSGSGTRSRTPPSCPGSPARRCSIRRWSWRSATR